MSGSRLWVVSELYFPEETSTGYILTRIAEGLSGRFDVHVLCGQPSYSARGLRAPATEVHNGVQIRRCRATTLNKDVLPFKLLNLVTITLSMFWNALWHLRRGDMVLVVTNPPSLPFLVALACRVRRARLVLLIHDVYPEVLSAAGMLRPDSLASRLGGQINRWLYRSAERIVVLGRDMQDRAAGRLASEERHRVVMIPNWADLELIQPASRAENSLLVETGLTDKFVVEYAGNMGYPNDMEGLLACAETLAADEKIHFLLLGGGAKRTWVRQAISERNLNNITLLTGRPRSEQPVFLNACDVNVISLVRGMVGVSVPSRMYNIMAAGKPIIAVTEDESELAQVVREERVGWIVPPHDPSSLAAAIKAAQADRTALAAMGHRARLAAENKYSEQRVLADYDRLFGELSKSTT